MTSPETALARLRSGCLAALATLLPVAAGACAQTHPAPCPGAAEATGTDGRIRIRSFSAVDATAGGALLGDAKVGPREMRAAVLLDYSGSMFPGYGREGALVGCPRCKAAGTRRNKQPWYYEDPEFRALLTELFTAAASGEGTVRAEVMLFNRDVFRVDRGRLKEVKKGDSVPFVTRPDDIGRVLATVPGDPIKANRKAAQKTYLKEATERAMELLGDEGLIWIVTDNIADRTGTGVAAADAARNLAFYNLLQSDPRLQAVFAYPLHRGSECSVFCGTSLFVYGVHFSTKERPPLDEADRLAGGHLRARVKEPKPGLLWNGALFGLARQHGGDEKSRERDTAGVPLRLKPLDVHVVSVDFERDDQGRARPLKCKRTSEFGEKVPCLANIVIRNELRHQRVDSAKIQFENGVLVPVERGRSGKGRRQKTVLPWASQVCAGAIKAQPVKRSTAGVIEVGPLEPGESASEKVLLMVPPVEVTPTGISEMVEVAFTDDLALEGQLTAKVQDVRTSLQVPAEEREQVYGAANLPQIFVSRSESEIRVGIPMVVPVQNDGKLLALLLLSSIGLLVLLLGGLVFRFQSVIIVVLVDGVEVDKLRMPRVSRRRVERGSVLLGYARRGVGRAVRFVGAKGITARKSSGAWLVSPPGGVEMRVELRPGSSKRRSASTKRSGGF